VSEIETWLDGAPSIAIAHEKYTRIRSLLAANHRAGASVLKILEDVDRSARRAYSPKGYDVADYELALLMYKIGGRATANIAASCPWNSLNRHCKTSCFERHQSFRRQASQHQLNFKPISQPVTTGKDGCFTFC